MSAAGTAVGLVLVSEVGQFGSAALGYYFGNNHRVLTRTNPRGADFDIVLAGDEHNIGDLHRSSDFAGQFLNRQPRTIGNAILFASCANDGVLLFCSLHFRDIIRCYWGFGYPILTHDLD